MTNVVEFKPGIVGDAVKITPDTVLDAAMGKLSVAVVLGIDHDGGIYCASSDGRPEIIALCERVKARLIADWE